MKKSFLLTFLILLILTGCHQAKPVKTIENLKDGIKGETTASKKYAAFAKRAKTEGHITISILFAAISKSESVHERNQCKALKNLGEKKDPFKPEIIVKSTRENLETAIDLETFESVTLYPQLLNDAKTEKVEKVEKTFRCAFNAELKHLSLFKKALEAFDSKTENTLPFVYSICPECGNIYEFGKINNKCALCGTSKVKFIDI